MRIGLVVPGFSAHDRDWCIPALRDLARTLATGQDEVRVIALRYPYARRRYRVDGAVETIALGGALSHGRATLKLWRRALALLRAEHHRQPFDVLHAFWATESGLLTAIAGRVLNVRSIVSLAGGELVALTDIQYGDQRLALERVKVAASLRLADAVTAGSRQLAATAERHVRRRVHLAPLGVDVERFARSSPSVEFERGPAARLLHVASLTPVKDQATLLRAFARLRDSSPGARLDIVGEGPLRGDLERLARELGIGAEVCFRGPIDHARLPAVYATADAFVLSSRHEAQSMVALEAAACGVALSGTRVGVLPELTSALGATADAPSLAQAMACALQASGASKSESTRRVRLNYGLQVCADRFRQLYTDND